MRMRRAEFNYSTPYDFDDHKILDDLMKQSLEGKKKKKRADANYFNKTNLGRKVKFVCVFGYFF